MRLFFHLTAIGMLGAAALCAQTAPAQPKTVIDIPVCQSHAIAVPTWSIGEGPGATSFGTENTALYVATITKAYDGCSPTLYRTMMSGQDLATVTITQEGNTNTGAVAPKLQWVLTGARIDSYQLSGSGPSGLPTEAISFTYSAVQTPDFEPSSVNPNASSMVLQGNGGCSFEVLSWQIGGTINTAPGQASTPRALALAVTKPVDSCTGPILQNLTHGSGYTGATLTQGSANGQPMAQIILTSVGVTSYQAGMSASGTPIETLQLSYWTIEFKYSAENYPGGPYVSDIGGWNFKTERPIP